MFRNFIQKLFKEFSVSILLVEFFLIVVAIFFGNLATDWNAERVKQAETAEALQLMCDELQQNYHNLLPYREYYQRSLYLLDSLDSIGEFEQLFEHREFQGINPPIVYTFAYEMAKNSSKLANIEHEKAKVVFRNYLHLEELLRTIEQTQQQLLVSDIEGPDNWNMVLNFYRESIELFYRSYAQLQKGGICPSVDASPE